MSRETCRKEKNMNSANRTYDREGPQGDVNFTRLDKLPDLSGLSAASPSSNGQLVVAHSETGHHHTIDASDAIVYETRDPLVAYLVPATDGGVRVSHQRGYDTHGDVTLLGGPAWEIRRQREYDPIGERRAAD
jgi:hypothetical protein